MSQVIATHKGVEVHCGVHEPHYDRLTQEIFEEMQSNGIHHTVNRRFYTSVGQPGIGPIWFTAFGQAREYS